LSALAIAVAPMPWAFMARTLAASIEAGRSRPSRAEAWFHLLLALAVATIVYITVFGAP
jgi:hypothetical protein